MKKKFVLIFEKIFGKNISFEQLIFIFLSLAGIFMSAIALAANISLGINPITYTVPFINIVVDALCIAYFIKTKKHQIPLFIVICVASFFLFPFLWFSTDGATGSTIPFVITSGVMFVVAVPSKKKKLFVLIITPILYTVFTIVEMYYPDIVVPYPDRQSQYVDIAFGLVLSYATTVGLASAVLSSYKNAAKQLEKLAYYDELTGATNFSYFRKRVTEILQEFPNEKFVCVQFDIRNFKIINEIFDRDIGDLVLKQTATKIMEVEKQRNHKDVVFSRISGDKFIAFRRMMGVEKSQTVTHLLDIIIKDMHYLNDFRPEISIGRYYTEKGDTADTVIERVNLAHNFARTSKSDTYVDYTSEFTSNLLIQTSIASKMNDALENREFVVYLQGKYSLIDESLCGAESLVRWINSDGVLITPNEFIPIFEQNGFITKLDIYMFTCCCEILASWEKNSIPLIPISVNFSRKHLTNLNFATELFNITQKYDVDPKLLEIELTETVVMDSDFDLIKFVDKLHAYGFQISMDDFGTGYSSLGLLKNLNIDCIKLDRSFFMEAQENANAHSVLSNMLSMTIDLGIKSVAEGVEDKTHVDLLRKLNCDVIQGYYFARPIPNAEFTAKMVDEIKEETILVVNDKNKRFNLRKNNELLMDIMESMPLSFTLWDENLNVVQCNKAAVSLIGFESEKEMLEKISEVFSNKEIGDITYTQADFEAIRHFIKLAFAEGYGRYDNWNFQTMDGNFVPCELTLMRIINKGQRMVACYARELSGRMDMSDM